MIPRTLGVVNSIERVMAHRSSPFKLAVAVAALVVVLWATGASIETLWITPAVIVLLWIALQLAVRTRHHAPRQ